MSIELSLKGSDRLLKTLAEFGLQYRAAAGDSLHEEGKLELAEAQNRTPFLTGNLHDSAYIKGPVVNEQGVSVTLGFGGPTAPYAVYVHEVLKPHEIGRAKFLESTVLESAKYMTTRVANRLRKAFTRVG